MLRRCKADVVVQSQQCLVFRVLFRTFLEVVQQLPNRRTASLRPSCIKVNVPQTVRIVKLRELPAHILERVYHEILPEGIIGQNRDDIQVRQTGIVPLAAFQVLAVDPALVVAVPLYQRLQG